MDIKTYKKSFEHSYALGIFPTVELILSRPQSVIKVLISSSYRADSDMDIFELCKRYNIKTEINDKSINKISSKENCFAAGVFKKYQCELTEGSHIVLVNPGNMGNMGPLGNMGNIMQMMQLFQGLSGGNPLGGLGGGNPMQLAQILGSLMGGKKN